MELTVKQFFCAVLASLTLAGPVSAFDRSEDAYGARDSVLFDRFPRSKIELYERGDTAAYLVGLEAPKTVNGVMVLDTSERLAGDLTRIMYRAPDNYSSDDVFDHFRAQLARMPHEVLFECHGRECGDSNLWANQIFEEAVLYGPDGYQHYMVARLTDLEEPSVVVLYAIKRGNRRVYLLLDRLIPEGDRLSEINISADTINAILREKGVFNLRGLQFDADDQLRDESYAKLGSVVSALRQNLLLELFVVGHLSGDEALTTLQQRAQKRAESVVEALVAQGIDRKRLEPQSVGPLAPGMQDNKQEAERIGLVVR